MAPDGQHIVAAISDFGKTDLWLLDGARSTSSRLTFDGGQKGGPVFSPDGSRVAFSSLRTGGTGVYQKSANGTGADAGKWQISVDGGVGARWRGDGKELFYFADRRLMAVEVSTAGGSFHAGSPKALFEIRTTSPFYWLNYAPSTDGRRFLIPVPVEQETALPMTVVLNWMAGNK